MARGAVGLDQLAVVEHLGLDRRQPDERHVASRLDASREGPESCEGRCPVLAGPGRG